MEGKKKTGGLPVFSWDPEGYGRRFGADLAQNPPSQILNHSERMIQPADTTLGFALIRAAAASNRMSHSDKIMHPVLVF